MKTICIYHSRDLDGWMSAAIVKRWYYYLEATGEQGILKDKIDFLGWDYGDDIPDLSGYDGVIMCDISFPAETMFKLFINTGLNLTYIDHHISAINSIEERFGFPVKILPGLCDTKFSACELTWEYFFPKEKMPEIVRLLGRYDCFGHKGTDEEQKVLEFQYGARQCITNYEEAYEYLINSITCDDDPVTLEHAIQMSGKSIYEYLKTEAQSIYKKAFPIFFENEDLKGCPKFGTYNFLCVNQERFNPINFGIDYHKDDYDGFACFHYKDGKWRFSLYNDDGKVDCSKIAKRFGGGGHKGAAGFIVDDLDDVFKN